VRCMSLAAMVRQLSDKISQLRSVRFGHRYSSSLASLLSKSRNLTCPPQAKAAVGRKNHVFRENLTWTKTFLRRVPARRRLS